MSEFRRGDKVLVERVVERENALDAHFIEVSSRGNGSGMFCAHRLCVHPHPGVPVADLLEELELLHKGPALMGSQIKRLQELRLAREAAQKPKGRWVWAKIGRFVDDRFVPAENIEVSEYHPDDIKRDE